MKKMICKAIETIEIQGIQLINVKWISSTGRVEATSRAQSADQYAVGITYSGDLKYAPCSDVRVFEPKFKVG